MRTYQDAVRPVGEQDGQVQHREYHQDQVQRHLQLQYCIYTVCRKFTKLFRCINSTAFYSCFHDSFSVFFWF